MFSLSHAPNGALVTTPVVDSTVPVPAFAWTSPASTPEILKIGAGNKTKKNEKTIQNIKIKKQRKLLDTSDDFNVRSERIHTAMLVNELSNHSNQKNSRQNKKNKKIQRSVEASQNLEDARRGVRTKACVTPSLDLSVSFETRVASIISPFNGTGNLTTKVFTTGAVFANLSRLQAYFIIMAEDFCVHDNHFNEIYKELSLLITAYKLDSDSLTRGAIICYRNRVFELAEMSGARKLRQDLKHAQRARKAHFIDDDVLTSKQRRSRKRAVQMARLTSRELKAFEFQGLMDYFKFKIDIPSLTKLTENGVTHKFPALDKLMQTLQDQLAVPDWATICVRMLAMGVIAYRQFLHPDPLQIVAMVALAFPQLTIQLVHTAVIFLTGIAAQVKSMLSNVFDWYYDQKPRTTYLLSQLREAYADRAQKDTLYKAHDMFRKKGYAAFIHTTDSNELIDIGSTLDNLMLRTAFYKDSDSIEFVQQPKYQPHNLGDGPAKAFLSLFGFFGFPDVTIPSMGDFTKFARSFNTLASGVKNAKDLGVWIANVLESAFGWFYEHITGNPYISVAHQDLVHRAERYVRDAEKLTTEFTPTNIRSTKDARDILALYDSGCLIVQEMTREGLESRCPQELMRCHTALSELALFAKKFFKSSPVRIQPLWINLYGQPGIGKTWMIPYLCAYMYNATHDDTFTVAKRYERKEDTLFWDGYDSQWVTTFDDLFQSSIKDARNAQAMTMIYAVNDATFPLHMADLRDKGTTNFESELVLSTTNCEKWENLALTDPVALHRRCLLDLSVRLDADCCDKEGKLLPEYTLHDGDSLSTKHFKAFQFFPRKTSTCSLMNKLLGTDVPFFSFKQVVDAGVILLKTAAARSEQTFENLNQLPELQGLVSLQRLWASATYHSTRGSDLDKSLAACKMTRVDYVALNRYCDNLSVTDDNRVRVMKFIERFCSLEIFMYYMHEKHIHSVLRHMDRGLCDMKELFTKRPHLATFLTLIPLLCDIIVARVLYSYVIKPLFLAIYPAFSSLFGLTLTEEEPHFDSQEEHLLERYSSQFGDTGPSGPQLTKKQAKAARNAWEHENLGYAYAHTDSNATAVMRSIAPNLVKCQINTAAGSQVGQMLFIGKNVAISAFHVVALLTMPGTTLQFNRQMRGSDLITQHEIPQDRIRVVQIGNTDKAVLYIDDKSFPSFPTITNHFLSAEDQRNNPLIEGIALVVKDRANELVIKPGRAAQKLNQEIVMKAGSFNVTLEPFRVDNVNAERGDSGGLYVIHNTQFSHKLLGLHSGGAGNGQSLYGVGSYWTSEELTDLLSQSDAPTIILPQNLFVPNPSAADVPNSAVCLGEPVIPFTCPGKTKLVRSAISAAMMEVSDDYVSTTIPAPLRPFQVVDPEDSTKKKTIDPEKLAYLKSPTQAYVPLPPDVYDVAKAHASTYPVPAGKKWRLTTTEAILGVPGINGLGPLDLSTSAGYPYVLQGKTRRDLIIIEGKTVTLDDALQKEIIEMETCYARNEFIVPVFLDCLKDERRPIEKAKAGKTRLFNVGPLALLIVARKYFGVFHAMMQANCCESGPSIGINVYKQQWGAIHTNLDRFQDVIATDVVGLDVHIAYEFARVYEVGILEWLSVSGCVVQAWERRVIRCLALSIVCHLHVSAVAVYMRLMGNASGHQATANFNSFTMVCILCTVWKRLMVKHLRGNLANYESFHQNVAFHVYGDDLMASVQSDLGIIYNPLSVAQETFRLFNIEFTSADKHTALSHYFSTTATETYLKRKFRKLNGLTVAPLDLQVIRDMVLWVTDKKRKMELTLSNIHTAALELVAHGEEVYTREINLINQGLKAIGQRPYLITWREHYVAWVQQTVLQCDFEPNISHVKTLKCQDPLNSDCRALEGNSSAVNCLDLEPHSGRLDKSPNLPLIPETATTSNEYISLATETESSVTTQLNAAHPELQPNVRDVEEETSLTKFSESSFKVREDFPSAREHTIPSMNPFPEQSMGGVMTRKYNVGTFAWTTTQASGTLAYSAVFPQTLLTIANGLRSKLDTFTLMRSGIELQIRANTTPFHFGSLMITHIASNDQYLNNMWQASGCRPMILSASAQDAITVRIPWSSPKNFCNVENCTGEIGSLEIYVLTPLNISNETAPETVDVSVFASLYDVTLAGYVSTGDDVMAHSSGEAFMKSTNSVLTGIKEATHTVTGIIKELSAGAGAAAPLAAMLDKPTSVAAVTPVNFNYVSDIAFGKGLDQANKLALDPDAILSVDPNIMGPWPSLHTFKEIAKVPMLLTVGSFNSSATAGMQIFRLSVDPATSATVGVPPNYTTYNPSYLAFCSQFAQFWRGSIKYSVMFFTSQFSSARIRISYLPKYSANNVVGELDSGDFISTVIDIKGDTLFDFSVPFLSDAIYEPVNPYNPGNYLSSAKISFSVVNQSVSADTASDATIQYAVFVAAGEDFQFARPVNNPILGLHGGSAVNTWQYVPHSVCETFMKPFRGLSDTSTTYEESHYTMSEPLDSLSDYMHRYGSGVGLVSPAGPSPVNPRSGGAATMLDPLTFFSMIFRFWRGAMRFKFFIEPSASTPQKWARIKYDDASNRYGSNGQSITFMDMKPVLEFEIPYYNSVPFRETALPVNPIDVASTFTLSYMDGTAIGAGLLCRAAGDDFCFAQLIGVPKFTYNGALLDNSRMSVVEKPAVDRRLSAETSLPFFPDAGAQFEFAFIPADGTQALRASGTVLTPAPKGH